MVKVGNKLLTAKYIEKLSKQFMLTILSRMMLFKFFVVDNEDILAYPLLNTMPFIHLQKNPKKLVHVFHLYVSGILTYVQLMQIKCSHNKIRRLLPHIH